MFKLVVLALIVAVSVAAPAPGFVHGAVSYAIPTAVSHQSRIDIHNTPLLATTYSVASPLVGHHLSAPLISAPVSHTARVDLHRTAFIGAPILGHGHGFGVVAAYPTVHGW